jgi:hypothetical protein
LTHGWLSWAWGAPMQSTRITIFTKLIQGIL